MRARKPASFWRENVIDVVILLRVLEECRGSGNESQSVIILRLRDNVTSLSIKKKIPYFLGEKEVQ